MSEFIINPLSELNTELHLCSELKYFSDGCYHLGQQIDWNLKKKLNTYYWDILLVELYGDLGNDIEFELINLNYKLKSK